MRWGRSSPFHDPENVRMAQAMLRDQALTVTAVAKRFGTGRNVI